MLISTGLAAACLCNAEVTPPLIASDVFIHPSILGASSCATSGCHGGASEKSLQYAVWSQRDVHSRSFATLTTARSARMAEALNIPDPTVSTRCTTCHAPFHAVQVATPGLLAPDARVNEGVSCASCHGPAGDWLRSHTRTDYTHADKVAAGMKELGDLNARAGSCVACHQNIDTDLVVTGKHPRLIFELDGQTASQPRHWRETANYNGAQAWQVGQWVALREVSWAMLQQTASVDEIQRWQALVWLMQRAEGPDAVSAGVAGDARLAEPGPENYARARDIAARQARALATSFNSAQVSVLLRNLASTHAEFLDSKIASLQHAYRAERLVLALDRLLNALPAEKRSPDASARLTKLFAQVQSIPGFQPVEFSQSLDAFARTLR
ncbi:multiheme c-type cytochrome [Rariglobus hedericola]|nr:multiheme c-type cytochrome [Rariglobus hedericola]